MNERMRRYLDDNWDESLEASEQQAEREEGRPKNSVALDRRQKGKEWGRAHAKFHKQVKKLGLRNDKP